MTADQSGGEYKSLIAPIRWSNSESLRISKSRRRKYARQRSKINKHCILRCKADENTKCLLGTPQAP